MKSDNNIVFGVHPILEALKSDREIEKIFISRELNDGNLKDIRSLAKQRGTPVITSPKDKLNRITRQNHQGILAFISPVSYQNAEEILTQLFENGKTPLIIALDGVTDTRNMGAIIRSAEFLGADMIVFPKKGSAMINADVVKTSAGAIFSIPLCRVSSLANTLKTLRDSGCQLYGCSEKSSKPASQIDFTIPSVLIMGSEDIGISHHIEKLCHSTVAIPRVGKSDSLNVSVASGILLYEINRQRNLV